MTRSLMSNYQRLPVAFTRGTGPWLFDGDGKRYLDAVGGVAVCGLGHAHPDLARAIAEQAATLVHTSNLYRIPLQEALGEALTARAGMENAFFCNSGAEANEAAVKLARLYGHARGVATPLIVCMHGSFHGRTMATLSATGSARAQSGFEPLVPGFVHVPYGDVDAVRRVAARQRNVVAVLVEPIQGEGGVNVPPHGYLRALRTLCDERGWLLMLDEVQTGMGRTGRWFACQHEDVCPDVMTLAKALGNGVPIGACLARGPAAGLFTAGRHGSTFGGNPLAARAALEVLAVIERDRLVERAAALGERLLAGFRHALDGANIVTGIRGRGLMLGIELAEPCARLVELGLAHGVLVNVTAERVLRLLPPLILGDADADLLVSRVADLVRAFATNA
ncbi:MAG: aspartate aminotransferase family protein [Gammaproteobacteria bacterium]|nr:aspartate aminotransferase family protein [Gammaproteobacteria bacterium]